MLRECYTIKRAADICAFVFAYARSRFSADTNHTCFMIKLVYANYKRKIQLHVFIGLSLVAKILKFLNKHFKYRHAWLAAQARMCWNISGNQEIGFLDRIIS